MSKKKISQLLLASSAIVTTFASTNDQVFSKETSTITSSQSIYEAKNQSIMGNSQATKDELKNYFKTLNIKNSKLSVSIDEFINIAYEEGIAEGVRGDLIVAQAFLETGYFTYGGAVKPQDNNFAGIGAIGGNIAGNSFKDVREGLRAQVQHLKAYASTTPLVNSVVDPRFKYVTRGSATNIEALSGKWAYPGYDKNLYSSYDAALNAGNTYGQRVYSIIEKATKKHPTTPDVKLDNKESIKAIKGQVVNVSTNVRLRQSSGTSSMVLGYLSNGQLFNIKGKSGDWYNIEHNGMVGYIHKNYVKEMIASIPIPPVTPKKNNPVITEQNNKTPVSSKGTVVNVSTNLRIRKDSNSNATIVGYLVNGESFDIKEQQGDWYKIEKGDKKGYIHKDYVKKSSDTLKENPVAIPPKPTENNTTVPKYTTTNTVAVVAKPTSPASNLKGQIINVSINLRIRKGPSTNSSVVGYLVNGQNLSIKEKSGSWYSIQCGDKVGYVHSDYVKVLENNIPNPSPTPTTAPAPTPTPTPNAPEKTPTPSKNEIGTVYNVSSNVRLRNMPNSSISSSTLAYLLPGTSFTILGMSGDWYNINYNGKVGYIHKDYVKKSQSTDNSNVINSKSYEKVLNVLQSQIGTPYIFGGAGETLNSALIDRLKTTFPSEAARGIYDMINPDILNKGYKAFDCSGLIQWGFKQAGINIGRTTWNQITNGTEVSLSNVKPGDLLFYSSLEHVGMYIGNGKWIEAPNSRNTIREIDVPWDKIVRARRIIN